MDFKCGACGRIIFNRRLTACEFCNAPIPKELLYTDEERRKIDREVKAEIHRQMVALQEEQKKGREKEDEDEKDAKLSDPRIDQLLALASARDETNGGGKK